MAHPYSPFAHPSSLMCLSRNSLLAAILLLVATILLTRDFGSVRHFLDHTPPQPCAIFCTVGLSLSVMNKGSPIYHANYGFPDSENVY